MTEELPDETPFTLDEAREWLHKVEDDAWLALSKSGAIEFVLCNLLLELARHPGFDARGFIDRLLLAAHLLETPQKLAAEDLLGRLRAQLASESPGTSNQTRQH